MKYTSKVNTIEFFLHIAAWMLVFVSPFLFLKEIKEEGIETNYFALFFVQFALMCIFYTNYAILIPKILFKNRISVFVICNAILISALSFSMLKVHEKWGPHPPHVVERIEKERMLENGGIHQHPPFELNRPPMPKPLPPPHHKKERGFHAFLVLIWVSVIAVLLRYTKRWFNSVAERKELERERAEMELKNLKNQLNPHFLFNTLNNIYALIGLQQEKAQQAVLDLSQLLRYALYEGNQQQVTLQKEVDFIENYIKLMKLRLTDSVVVTSETEIGNNGNKTIAQMLFIALVENAFKHGVSLEQPSYINMKMEVNDESLLTFAIENSNHPKNSQDKSGSGIGLENLKRRLSLLYPDRYTYKVEADEHRYKTTLTIKLEQ